ncbi:hypothetical protein RR11_2817 [Ruegeria sp. R11]|nr:hypothetical protein RR11_2817 [Ruegeria sp. R11]
MLSCPPDAGGTRCDGRRSVYPPRQPSRNEGQSVCRPEGPKMHMC